METKFKSTQCFVTTLVGILLKMAKKNDIWPKNCHFQPFQHTFSTAYMFVYIPYSIHDYIFLYIWTSLNFQKIM